MSLDHNNLNLHIFKKNIFENRAILGGTTDITSENIMDLLTASNCPKEKLKIEDMYNIAYKKRFALYSIDTSGKQTEPYNLIGYSYGTEYNRRDKNTPLIPKVFYMDIDDKILEIKFYQNNVLVQFVNNKDIGYDAYYINYSDQKYLIQGDIQKVIDKLLTDKNIYLGSTYFNFDYNNLSGDERTRLASIGNTFSQTTGFRQNYTYRTFQKISLNDILHETNHLLKIRTKQQNSFHSK